MESPNQEPSGLHWQAFEWLTDHTFLPVVNFVNRQGPSHEQIVELYENFKSLTEPLKVDGEVEKAIIKSTVEKVDGTFSEYNRTHKQNAATIIERGSAYHKMRARIEAGKGNMPSAITHWLKAAGYSSLTIPACFGVIGYVGLGFSTCGTIEIAKLSYNALRSPGKSERVSKWIDSYRNKRSFNNQVKSTFYSLVDEKI